MSKVVVFDLDDTLYNEIDFVKSGFRQIACYLGDDSLEELMISWYYEKKNVFETLNDYLKISVPIDTYLTIYRNHVPSIHLSEDVKYVLQELKNKGYILGLITDGRSITQRNKITALGLYSFIDKENILISEETGVEKPARDSYSFFMSRYPKADYYYIGDNPNKDFIAPNLLGWITIQLVGDDHIHSNTSNIEAMTNARIEISSINELLTIIAR